MIEQKSTAPIALEPHLTCAFAVQSSPGAFAVLFGAGVSVGSGVPSAWGVQDELLRRVARLEGEEPDDPFAWYQQRFGKASTYDDLLAMLTHTQAERQALLRDFFEPTEAERDEGLKRPTPAHRAVARMATAGRIRIILTTNFDRLTETALRDEGVEPTVVSSPADIPGLNPLHAQRCLVVHLHGDYLNPSAMLNTAEELGTYSAEVDALLDQILREYGLIITGWSATWDTALRAAISRNPNRFFATYWIDPFPLSDLAEDLRVRRGAIYVREHADTFLGKVADACDSLADSGRRHPLTVPLAVSTAKRALAGAHTAIPLHDTLRAEIGRLYDLDILRSTEFSAADPRTEHASRLAKIDAALEVPAALVATAAYWGDAETDNWWIRDIARLARRPHASGSTALINLTQYPATAMLYTAGTAATAARRYDLVVRLLTEPETTDNDGQAIAVSIGLFPGHVLSIARSHRWLYQRLHPLLADHLGLGDAVFTDAFEEFEYLRLVHATSVRLHAESRHDEGPQWERAIARLEQEVAAGVGPEERGQKEVELLSAIETAREARKARARRVPMHLPHIRALGYSDNYIPSPAVGLAAALKRDGVDHPLMRAGLCDGNPDQMRWMMTAVDDAFNDFANDAAWSTITGNAGFLPSGTFYPDEIGKWSEP